MGKKKKSVSQVVIAQSDTSDDLKPETDTNLEETKLEENEKNTSEISITTPTPTEETCQNRTAETEQLNEDTPILSNTEDAVEHKPENDQKVDEVKEESKTVETTTSENSVELKEIQIKPEDEPNKKTRTNCSKGWCVIL